MNDEADSSDTQLRVSCDAKAAIKVGDYSRLGSSRVKVQAADHDFKPDDVIVPYGICLPKHKELSLYLTHSKVTSDFIVDCLDAWWTDTQARFPKVSLLVLDLDNGPENQSRRTQFMKRMVEFVDRHHIDVRLAYYPPYHSKYNPIERCWCPPSVGGAGLSSTGMAACLTAWQRWWAMPKAFAGTVTRR